MAVHRVNKHIAIAEYGTNPRIYIYAYPTFAEVAVLEGKYLYFKVIYKLSVRCIESKRMIGIAIQ